MSVCQTLDSTLLSFNVQDQLERKELEQTICEQSEAVLEAIIKKERKVIGTAKGDNQQTELIGICIYFSRVISYSSRLLTRLYIRSCLLVRTLVVVFWCVLTQ